MPPGFVLLANLAVGALLVAVAGTSRLARVPVRRSLSLASLPLLIAAVLSVYVFGDDNYRGNGISRSQGGARGALGSMFVLTVALMAVCAAGLRVLARKNDCFGSARQNDGQASTDPRQPAPANEALLRTRPQTPSLPFRFRKSASTGESRRSAIREDVVGHHDHRHRHRFRGRLNSGSARRIRGRGSGRHP